MVASGRVRWPPFLAAVGCTVLLSVFAYGGGVPEWVGAHDVDKVLHGTMTFSLTFLLGRVLRARVALAGLLVFVPVATDEYLQRFSLARSSDWADLAADAIGIVLAIALTLGLRYWRSRRREPLARELATSRP